MRRHELLQSIQDEVQAELVWYVDQFLFGLHLVLIGYLAYRSGYIPLGEFLLAIWLVIRARRIATGAAVWEADSAPGRALDASSA